MKEFYSGRFDMELSYEETAILCADFAFLFQMERFIFAFEHLSKDGLPVKGHIHWVGSTEFTQRSLQRFFAELKYNYSTKKLTSRDFPKVYHYTLKQSDVICTDYEEDELAPMMAASLEYNRQLGLNTLKDHIPHIIKQLEGTDRDDIFYGVAMYCIKWNKNSDNIKKIKMPNGNNLLAIVQQIEQELLTEEQIVENYLLDNFMVTSFTRNSLKERIKRKEQREEIFNMNLGALDETYTIDHFNPE